MQQISIERPGGPERLKSQDVEAPTPGLGEVLIKVAAAGVNYNDTTLRRGLDQYWTKPLPSIPGHEVAGTIAAVGPRGNQKLIGQAVIAYASSGAYREQLVVGIDKTAPKPARLSFAEAAALPMNWLTAWCLARVMGNISRGQKVLIHNAGGGVGLALLAICRQHGATTIGTASIHKHDWLIQQGMDVAIDYQTEDWLTAVLQITGNEGVDLVLDPFGGSHWRRSYRALKPTGRLGMYGQMRANEHQSGPMAWSRKLLLSPFLHPASLLGANRGLFALDMSQLWHNGPLLQQWLTEGVNAVNQGWFTPKVDQCYPMSAAADAHRHLEERRNLGKIILVPDRQWRHRESQQPMSNQPPASAITDTTVALDDEAALQPWRRQLQ